MGKSAEAFRTISEVAAELDVPQHVLRFWETKFNQIKPLKRGGGRRYYRPEDVDLLRGIRALLYTDGFTIKGVQKVLREQGVRTVADAKAPGSGATLVGRARGQRDQAANTPKTSQPAAEEAVVGKVDPPAVPARTGTAEVVNATLSKASAAKLTAILERLQEAKMLLERRRVTRSQAPAAKRALTA